MGLSDLYSGLVAATGLPVAYRAFNADDAPGTPFIVYYVVERDDERADDSAYVKNNSINVELYTDKKDLGLEEKLESFFDGRNIIYLVSEDDIPDEKMMVRTYEFDLMEEV